MEGVTTTPAAAVAVAAEATGADSMEDVVMEDVNPAIPTPGQAATTTPAATHAGAAVERERLNNILRNAQTRNRRRGRERAQAEVEGDRHDDLLREEDIRGANPLPAATNNAAAAPPANTQREQIAQAVRHLQEANATPTRVANTGSEDITQAWHRFTENHPPTSHQPESFEALIQRVRANNGVVQDHHPAESINTSNASSSRAELSQNTSDMPSSMAEGDQRHNDDADSATSPYTAAQPMEVQHEPVQQPIAHVVQPVLVIPQGGTTSGAAPSAAGVQPSSTVFAAERSAADLASRVLGRRKQQQPRRIAAESLALSPAAEDAILQAQRIIEATLANDAGIPEELDEEDVEMDDEEDTEMDDAEADLANRLIAARRGMRANLRRRLRGVTEDADMLAYMNPRSEHIQNIRREALQMENNEQLDADAKRRRLQYDLPEEGRNRTVRGRNWQWGYQRDLPQYAPRYVQDDGRSFYQRRVSRVGRQVANLEY